jgi:hypothetical protein
LFLGLVFGLAMWRVAGPFLSERSPLRIFVCAALFEGMQNETAP